MAPRDQGRLLYQGQDVRGSRPHRRAGQGRRRRRAARARQRPGVHRRRRPGNVRRSQPSLLRRAAAVTRRGRRPRGRVRPRRAGRAHPAAPSRLPARRDPDPTLRRGLRVMRVLVPMGTRPEIVKLAPVVRALMDDDRFVVRTLATGQHYDPELTDTFYGTFGLEPDDRWTLPTSEAHRMGEMLTLASVELAARRPDLVLVLGDTHTVPLFCLAARNARIPVAHLEAGLRSFNPTSVEEVNRRVAATTASLHFAPTDPAARFLEAEGIPAERVRVGGNPGIHA